MQDADEFAIAVRKFVPKSVMSDKELKIFFKAGDEDGGGTIDAGEFAALCKDLGMALSPEEVGSALEAMDTNGDGSVDWEEFCFFFESF